MRSILNMVCHRSAYILDEGFSLLLSSMKVDSLISEISVKSLSWNQKPTITIDLDKMWNEVTEIKYNTVIFW